MGRARRTPLAATAVLVVAMVLVAAGCGSSDDATTGPTSTTQPPLAPPPTVATTASTVCDLLTPADVSVALGVVPKLPPATDGLTTCDYSGQDSSQLVSVRVTKVGSPAAFTRAAEEAGAKTTVKNVGDAALEAANGKVIFVLRGDAYVRIDVSAPTAKATVIRTLASTAASRMKA